MSVIDAVIHHLASRQHGVVAVWQLIPLGVSSSAVHRRAAEGRLRRLHRGVYAVGTIDRNGYWMAAVLAGGEETFLSHREATALWDLRSSARTAIDITVVGGKRGSRPRLTVHCVRELHSNDRAEVDGIPVTSIPRTLLDLAEVVPATELRRAYEAAERHRILDFKALNELIARSNGRRGLPALLALLDYDPRTALDSKSDLESAFLDLVREAGLPLPSVNVVVEGYLVDAYWPAARLVVELQSYEHHAHRQAFDRDCAKLGRLTMAGHQMLPLTYRQLMEERAWVVGALESILLRPRGPGAGPGPRHGGPASGGEVARSVLTL
jgi:very-short-patch-repair endonuclease